MLLGLAPLAALPSSPAARLREQVLRLVSSDTPDAVAHRATVLQRTPSFGHHGFPKPLDPPKSSAGGPGRAGRGGGCRGGGGGGASRR